jgi:cytidine deaminase
MEILDHAAKAMKNAYAPYSRFRVGSAVVGGSGEVYIGCNVENASYGATICAERMAIGAAIAAGEKKVNTVAVINSTARPCSPCGLCLQVIAEFGQEVKIITASNNKKLVEQMTLKDLMPRIFDKSSLPK